MNTKKRQNVWYLFNRGNNLCKANITVNGKKLDNVKTFKYLGITLGAKNCSFKNTLILPKFESKKSRVCFK